LCVLLTTFTFALVYAMSVPATPCRPQKKHTPVEFWSKYLVCFCDFQIFSLVCAINVPAALRRCKKKLAPGCFEHAGRLFECLDAFLLVFCSISLLFALVGAITI
jgi:hypothetical protein